MSECDIVHIYMGPVKRKAVGLTYPKTVSGEAVFSQNEDGSYDVYLVYVE